MLSGSLKLAEKYDYLADKFRAGYKWLAEHDINSMQDGKYEIRGDEVFADIQSYETEPAEKRKFEAHDIYFDIQYMASGCEMFGVCHREGLTLKEAPEGKDLTFFEDPESCSMVLKYSRAFSTLAGSLGLNFLKISCIAKKNRFAGIHNPYTKCNYFALFDKGIDNVVSLPDSLKQNPNSGIILKGAHWYYTDSNGTEWHWTSKKAFTEELRNNESLYNELIAKTSAMEQTEYEQMESKKEEEAIRKEMEEVDRQVAGELFEE